MKFEDFEVGMQESISKTITEADILMFSAVSLDTNPVHLDSVYASKTIFKKRIAHGMLCSSLISAVLGTKLPGYGSIYLEQNLKFLAAVYIEDTVTATATITELNTDKKIITLNTVCKNQDGKEVITGTAKIMKRE